MAETYSEKVVKDTLHYLEANGYLELRIRLHQVSGQRYSSRAPMDFMAATTDGQLHVIEVKEVGKPTMPFGQFDTHQRRLLHAIDNAWAVLRFYDGEHNRNHSRYWEEWFWTTSEVVPEPGERGSINLKRLAQKARSAERPTLDGVTHIAGYAYGEKWGFSERRGLTTRDNPTEGLTNIPLVQADSTRVTEGAATCAT